jgi:hypothetical protein
MWVLQGRCGLNIYASAARSRGMIMRGGFREKLIVVYMMKNSSTFTEHEDPSLRSSQTCREPDESTHTLTPYFFHMNFSIIMPSTPRPPPMWFFLPSSSCNTTPSTKNQTRRKPWRHGRPDTHTAVCVSFPLFVFRPADRPRFHSVSCWNTGDTKQLHCHRFASRACGHSALAPAQFPEIEPSMQALRLCASNQHSLEHPNTSRGNGPSASNCTEIRTLQGY